ncbi:MAG: hormogonium polysaccharide biosynthesis protein HpsL [Cyanobacteria bacterium J06623_4]
MVSRSAGKRSIKQSLKSSKKRSATKSTKKGGKVSAKSKRKGRVIAQDEDEAPIVETLSPRQKLIQERAAAKRRQEIVSYVATTFFICAFLGLLFGILVEPKIGVAAGGALMCLALSFKFQRLALYAFIIYIPFAGTVTYALGGSSILQIAKDIFYIPALIGVFQFCRKNNLPIILPKAIKPPLILLIIIVLMNVLLANIPDQIGQVNGKWPIIMAIWGIKILFGYIPLVACIYYLIRNKDDMLGLLRLQAVLVLIACSLGLIQYFMLLTGRCAGTTGVGEEMFRASLQAKCFVGGSLLYAPAVGQIRLPGTFVAPWQWGWFLISAAFFSFGTTFSDKSAFWRGVGLVSLVAVMIMAVISGQRIALVLVPSALIVLTILTGQVANLKRFIPIGILLAIIVSYLLANNPEVVQTRVDSLYSRWTASPPQQFIMEQFDQVWDQQRGIFGHGVGRATNSARTFAKTILIETYHPKLIYELGPLGLIAALSVYTALTVATFRVYRKTKDKNLRSYAASMWVFIFFISYCPYYYPLDVDPVGVYYWLAAGIVLKIPEIERQEREKAAAAALGQTEEAIAPPKGRRRKQKNQPTFT